MNEPCCHKKHTLIFFLRGLKRGAFDSERHHVRSCFVENMKALTFRSSSRYYHAISAFTHVSTVCNLLCVVGIGSNGRKRNCAKEEEGCSEGCFER